MKCTFPGCNEPVVEISGALGLGLCRTHLHAEVLQPLENKPLEAPRYLTCAGCGEPTNLLATPGEPDIEVFHTSCQEKRAPEKANKSRVPTENK